MCCLLGSMVACLLVPCTSRERSGDMVHYNGLDSLTVGLKQTTEFCMIENLYHDLYQGVWGWFCGFASELASELELAHSGAVHPSNSALVPVPVRGRSNAPYRRSLHTKQKTGFGAFRNGRGRERVAIHASAAECTASHCPSQMPPLPRLPL
jgi:hypothetical protein